MQVDLLTDYTKHKKVDSYTPQFNFTYENCCNRVNGTSVSEQHQTVEATTENAILLNFDKKHGHQ